MPKSPISSSFSGSTPTSSHKKVRPAAYSDSTDSKMAWKYWACWHLVPKRPKWGNWDNSGRTLGIVIRTHKKVWGWRFTFQKRPWSTISTQKFGKTWEQQVKSHLIHQIRWVISCLGIHVFTDGYFEERFVKPICPSFQTRFTAVFGMSGVGGTLTGTSSKTPNLRSFQVSLGLPQVKENGSIDELSGLITFWSTEEVLQKAWLSKRWQLKLWNCQTSFCSSEVPTELQ